jgi:hypothetical protein
MDPNQMPPDQMTPPMTPDPTQMDQGQPPMDPSMGQQFSQPNPNPVQDGKPYFMGGEALIRFSSGEEGFGPETYWLADQSNHTIRPFESHMALDAAFGDGLQEALQNAVTVTPPKIDSNGDIVDGVLEGFSILGPEYAIKEDGTSKHLDFSPHQLKSRYGKPINESVEGLATEVLDGFLGLLKNNEDKTDIPAAFINKLMEDQKLMAFYISALAYGEYTMGDIYSDVARRYHHSKN